MAEKLFNSTIPNVYMKDPIKIKEKVNKLITEGNSNLKIIADFDATLTQYSVDGKRNPVSHHVFAETEFASQEFKQGCDALGQSYFPKILSPEIPENEKLLVMEQHWREYNNLYINEKLTATSFREALASFNMKFRDGTSHFIEQAEKKEVPILILSAGVADVIEHLLDHAGLFRANIDVIANRMLYHDEVPYHCHDFTYPSVHVLNKGHITIQKSRFHSVSTKRESLLLLGDSLNDLTMAQVMPYKTILTVGFLNDNIEANLTKYMDNYDVVIVEDSSFDWVNEFMSLVN